MKDSTLPTLLQSLFELLEAHRPIFRQKWTCLREGLVEKPVFLIVVRGMRRTVNGRHIKRDPAFYLVSAVQQENAWVLPLPIEELLAWAWHRWELDVEHREFKSGFGFGEKQCWTPHATVPSVQWSAWGLCHVPASPGRWWRGPQCWSFNTLWRGYRAALWNTQDFRVVWTGTGDNWLKKGDWISGLWNSVTAAARA